MRLRPSMQLCRDLRRVMLTGITLAATLTMPTAHASGGEPGTARLVPTSHIQPEPEALRGYLHGKLGILWPEYDRVYLMMAYRQAEGLRPLSDADVQRVLAPKINGVAGREFYYGPSGNALAAWGAARKALGLAELPYPLSTGWRTLRNYVSVDNCQPGAFAMATQTLADRMREHGNDVAAVKQWVASQDSVFSWCETSGDQRVAMPELGQDAPAWLVKDRVYQSAATLLYQGKMDEAAKAFDAIAADQASPWREWAAYLSVRAWWRRHFNDPEGYPTFTTDTPDWTEHPIAKRLKQLEASAKNPQVARAAAGLYTAVAARYSPKATYDALWRRMRSQEPVDDMTDWVSDIRWMWALLPARDFADDWLLATRAQFSWGNANQDGMARVMTLTKAQRNCPIWLASALMTVTPQTPGLSELVEATRKTKPDTPLYMHFAWHRARLALAGRDYAAARAELATVRPLLKDESLGTRQVFDQLEMIVAPSLDELSRHLVRTAVGRDMISYGDFNSLETVPPDQRENLLDIETRNWMVAQLDGKELLELARDSRLPASVRRDIAGEAWRWGAWRPDAVLEREAVAVWADLAGKRAIAEATTSGKLEDMRFQMARALLLGEVSRLKQLDYTSMPRGYASAVVTDANVTSHWDTPPAFHNEARQKQQAADLAALEPANETNWMGKQILPWMRANPKFAEGPAILEKLVYASRYGMPDTATSRQAFQLLHQQYPKSPEAQRTRYFY